MTEHAGLAAVLVAALALAGCWSTEDRSGNGGNGGDSNGRLTLSITDAPVDDAEVVGLELTGIELKLVEDDDEGAIQFLFDQPREIENLLDLQGGARDILVQNLSVPPGEYEWITLLFVPDGASGGEILTTSYVQFLGGGWFGLAIPGDPEIGFRLQENFTIPAGEHADLVLDIDLRRALVPTDEAGLSSYYFLRPMMRLVDRQSSGHIEGTVASLTAGAAGCTPAVYVFEEGDEPRDVFDNEGPITTGLVRQAATTLYRYSIGFLPEGTYDLALTCDADLDQPDEDDSSDVGFYPSVTVQVHAGQTTEQDLP
ncbi:MAG: DUF4382 domain-containing protein [Ectothiorhodospiraceae bacterium]|nr:DUF4382 domain-containing protein [Ectothiorhodospiraceae bacterium]